MKMSCEDWVYLAWFSAKPISAECVQYFQRQRRMGWNVRLLLAQDVETLAWVSADERAAFGAAATEDDQYQILHAAAHAQHEHTITVIQMHTEETETPGNAAIAIYTVVTGSSHELLPAYPAEYTCYVISPRAGADTDGARAGADSWIAVSQVMPPHETTHSWLITSPHLIPHLGRHKFVVYARPGVILDTALLNRALVEMLHQERAVGLCEHENSFPSVNECLHHATKTRQLVDYIKWRASPPGGGLDMGSDGSEGRRLFSSAVVMHDMHHPQAIHFASRWQQEAAWSGEVTISLYFAAQLVPSALPLLLLPGDIDTNSPFYHMKRLVTIPRHLPVNHAGKDAADTLIPRKLHMIWVGDAPPPESCLAYERRWASLMPHWRVKLWRNGDVAQFGEDVQRRITSAVTGAQKADILRAFIVEAEGGIYMDADMEPHRSLEPLVALQEPLVLCHDLPLTWEYVQNGFFGAAPHHPVMQYLCNVVSSATLNTKDVHMHTGPRALGAAVRHAPNPSGAKYYMLPSRAFYYNKSTTPGAFATHMYANTWG